MLRFGAKKPSVSNPPAKGGKTRGPFASPLVRGVKLGFSLRAALSFYISLNL